MLFFVVVLALLGNCPLFGCCSDIKMSIDHAIVISSDESEGNDELPNVKYPRYVLPGQRTHFDNI